MYSYGGKPEKQKSTYKYSILEKKKSISFPLRIPILPALLLRHIPCFLHILSKVSYGSTLTLLS
jgi:hypothetical protein